MHRIYFGEQVVYNTSILGLFIVFHFAIALILFDKIKLIDFLTRITPVIILSDIHGANRVWIKTAVGCIDVGLLVIIMRGLMEGIHALCVEAAFSQFLLKK